jgi:PAS domain S-box-containing protein
MSDDKVAPGTGPEAVSKIREADKYRLIVENTPLLVSTATMEMEPVFTYASPSHEVVLGYRPEEMVGQSIFALAHPDDVGKMRAVLQDQVPWAASGEVPGPGDSAMVEAEGRLRHADGSWKNMRIVGRSIGQELMFAAQDITEQSEAHERLVESEERFRLMFENAPDGYYIIDREGRFIDGNKRAEELVGAPRNELIGKSFFSVGLIHPKHLPRAAAHLARNLLGRRAGPTELLIRQKGGTWINIEITTFPVNHRAGRWILGIARDITERKKNEAVQEEARALAEAASKAKSSFLADMSHELRTPLNAIIGFSEILLDENVGNPNAIQKEYLQDIKQSGWHLLNVIDEVLDLAKIESGQMELQRGPVSVEAIVQTGLTMVREKAQKNGITLSSKVVGVPDFVALDERKVKQVIFNLLSNSVKFTPNGGKVSLQASYFPHSANEVDGEDAPEMTGEGGILVVEVTDTGIGFAPEFLDSLFEPFVQGEQVSRDGPKGTGLGLALSRRLAELHDGHLSALSDGPGKGSHFTAAFPTWETIPEESYD